MRKLLVLTVGLALVLSIASVAWAQEIVPLELKELTPEQVVYQITDEVRPSYGWGEGSVLHNVQYTVVATSRTEELRIKLEGDGDVDLCVLLERPFEVDDPDHVWRDEHLEPGCDWLSSNGNYESVHITPGSSPPLEAGTYYIAVVNWEPYPVTFTVTATVTPPPITCESAGSIELVPNELLAGSIKANTLTVAKENQYCIMVSKETEVLAIALQSREGGNLDLHVRVGMWVELSGSKLEADFSLVSPDGSEYIILSKSQLQAGPYFIAVENLEEIDQEFTIIAIPIPTIYEGGFPVTGTVEPPLLALLLRYLQTERGQLSLTQYKIEIPEDAKSLEIRLEGLEDKNVDLHIRYGEPVEIKDGKVVADLSSISLTGEEAIVISGEFLKPGTYYIAVEGLEPPQDFKITVTIDCGEGGRVAALTSYEMI